MAATDPGVEFPAYFFLERALAESNDGAARDALVRAYLARAEAAQDHFSIVRALWVLILATRRTAAWDHARELTDRMSRLAPGSPFPVGARLVIECECGSRSDVEEYRSLLLERFEFSETLMGIDSIPLAGYLTGSDDGLREAVVAARAFIDSARNPYDRSHGFQLLAMAAVARNDAALAAEVLEETQPPHFLNPWTGIGSGHLGPSLRRQVGRPDEAVALLEAHLTQLQPDVVDQAFMRTELARALAAGGGGGGGGGADRQRAGSLLDEVVDASEEHRMTARGEIAGRLLAAVQEQRVSRQLPAGLTQREVEVLHHVARGLTDKEIAAALHISAKTVANHVAHARAKTHSATRTQAVSFARDHDLIRGSEQGC